MTLSPRVGGLSSKPTDVSPSPASQRYTSPDCLTTKMTYEFFNELIEIFTFAQTSYAVTNIPNDPNALKKLLDKLRTGGYDFTAGTVSANELRANGKVSFGLSGNDYIQFDDANNTFSCYENNAISGAIFQSGELRADGKVSFGLSGNDYIQFDEANNTFSFYENGLLAGSIVEAGTFQAGNVTASTNITSPNLNGTNAIITNISADNINVTGGDLKIQDATNPLITLTSTSADVGFNQTVISQTGTGLAIQTRNNSGSLVSTDYLSARNASGATSHSWSIENVEKLAINAAGVITVSGEIDINQAIKSSNGQVASTWCQFDGTGTPTIQDEYNVSSITDLGTGQYRLNFTNALPASLKYAVSITLGALGFSWVTARSTTSVTIQTYGFTDPADQDDISVLIFDKQ